MIKHIVMFRVKDEAEGATKQENLDKMKVMLEALPSKIKEIKYYEVGLNYNQSERASDIVIISAFDSKETLATYSAHPEHRKVVDFILKVSYESRVVDFEA